MQALIQSYANRLRSALSLCLLPGLLTSACSTPTVFTLPTYSDQNGFHQEPLRVEPGVVHVLFFVTTRCSVSNSYAPEIMRIVTDYSDRPVRFFLVHVDPLTTRMATINHALDFGYEERTFRAPPRILIDSDHSLVKATRVTRTPEVIVVIEDNPCVYRGRIDNSYAALNEPRAEPTQRDLRIVLDALLSGTQIDLNQTEAVGTRIPELN